MVVQPIANQGIDWFWRGSHGTAESSQGQQNENANAKGTFCSDNRAWIVDSRLKTLPQRQNTFRAPVPLLAAIRLSVPAVPGYDAPEVRRANRLRLNGGLEPSLSILIVPAYKFTGYFENEVLRKRPYIRREWCIRVIEAPLRVERQGTDAGVSGVRFQSSKGTSCASSHFPIGSPY